MRSRLASLFALAAFFVLTCCLAIAFAAPTEQSTDAQSTLDVGALSDRYESLKELGTSLTDEEGVVIATRVGVLVSTNRALNNSDVSFSGEVVGDVLRASEEGHKWLNLRGSSNSVISVYVDDSQADLVQHVGDYHNTGTTLKIAGNYHIACPEHQGELDVHAASIEIVDGGGPVTHMIESGKLGLAFVLCALAFIVLGAFIWARERARKGDDS